MIVLDSCAYVDALIRPVGDPLRRRIAGLPDIHVPAHFDVEVADVLRRLHHQESAITAEQGQTEIHNLRNARISRHGVLALLDDMWSHRNNLSMHDAAYVTLAADLQLPLVTTDKRLANAPSLACRIELF